MPHACLSFSSNPLAHLKYDKNVFTTGIGLVRFEQVGLRISGIWENSPAAKAGLHPGDLILKINGKRVTKSTSDPLFDDGVSSLALLVESNGAQHSVTVQKSLPLPAPSRHYV